MAKPTENEVFTGSCLCGEVKYSVSAPPSLTVICHCHECRKSNGSAFMINAIFDEENFTLISGEDVISTYVHDRSGKPPIHRSFCGNCGGRLWGVSPTNPAFAGKRTISLGSFDEGKGGLWKPQIELFSPRCWDWVSIQGEVTKFDTVPSRESITEKA